ncbi:transcriptional regulator PtsJ [Pseudorhodoferax sp. Leaf267]|uniref:MocR-like B6 salvage transcription factor PtsJ n=1 Tax=Pseudorhodoferax sp. Leaf267 TaxID=1736316 RepID=UPI0007015863|nr:transcriptional regulator PtsJ [Pseudorhodoferax sp. Leaf267]KQP17806.1 transcriptional regulator [Pseudorhodoferax sp. Leaf267]
MHLTGSTVLEIFESVRLQVQSGALQPGAALPPVRDLALQLGVNRNTVASAYKRLTAAGIALAQGRLGTTISAPVAAGEQEGRHTGSPLVDMASGNPNPAWLPAVASLFPRLAPSPRLYGDATVNTGLLALARPWFDPDCPAGYALNLTHGAVDAMERLAVAHLVPGDRVAVEDPCFLGTINALRIAGMQAAGVAIDAQGMRPDALEAVLAAGAQAVLVTPRAHNPTGCSLTPGRAAALRAVLARFAHVLVIVDDHFALLAESAYQSILPANAGRWALVRSVSKALGPDLRLAFLASDEDTARKLRLRLAPGMGWVSHLLQDLVEACLRSPDVAAQTLRTRTAYAAQRAQLVQALRAHGIAAPLPPDGFNVWVPLPIDAREVVHAMARRGWLLRSGDAFDVQARTQAMRITVATLEDGQAARLAADLGACLEAQRRGNA